MHNSQVSTLSAMKKQATASSCLIQCSFFGFMYSSNILLQSNNLPLSFIFVYAFNDLDLGKKNNCFDESTMNLNKKNNHDACVYGL